MIKMKIEIENEIGEKVFINVLPYPTEARFKEDRRIEETFFDKITFIKSP